ncbi:TetR/AcrR family transcriptional regulator [Geodermatophilus sp. URMC 64]
MAQTRERAIDAAIELLGDQGLRALTHARVDERAGLPKGSTSNHFRTRQALLSGVVERFVEIQMPQADAASSARSADELVDALCDLVGRALGADRTRTAARLALFVEAGHNPAVQEALARGRAALVAPLLITLARLGARDPHAATRAVVACLQGLLLGHIARLDDVDPRPALDLVVRAALS